MRAESTFTVASFTPSGVEPEPAVATGLPVSIAWIEKQVSGAAEGRSVAVFTAAFDQATGTGTYVAMESFEGLLDGRTGAFNFAHSATTGGSDRSDELFVIVPQSGTGDFVGIVGGGGMAVDDDGTHQIWFEYELT